MIGAEAMRAYEQTNCNSYQDSGIYWLLICSVSVTQSTRLYAIDWYLGQIFWLLDLANFQQSQHLANKDTPMYVIVSVVIFHHHLIDLFVQSK